MFENPARSAIDELLRSSHSIAVIGLSDDPSRPSHHVARALQRYGYRIVPVNPAVREILGERSWPDLESAIAGVGAVDVVEVFRRPEYVAAIVEDAIRLKVPALWLQEGVIDEVAANRARAAGIFTVMNRCMLRDRSALS